MSGQGEPLARCWWVLRPGGDSWSGRRRVSYSGAEHGSHAGKCWRHVAAGRGAGSGTGTSALLSHWPESLALESFADEPAGFGRGVGGVAPAERIEDGGDFERDAHRPVAGVPIGGTWFALAAHAGIVFDGHRHGNCLSEPAYSIIREISTEINPEKYPENFIYVY